MNFVVRARSKAGAAVRSCVSRLLPFPGLMHMTARRLLLIALWLCPLVALPGCGDFELTYTEVRRVDEPLTDDELRAFLDIARHLPGGRLPQLPALFLPPPEWNPERTLPVQDLVESELLTLAERWEIESLARVIPNDRQTARRLRMWRMTRDQFLGLILSVSAAVGRSTIRENQNLLEVQQHGQEVVAVLRRDDRPFHALEPEIMHDVLHRAAWITRFDRSSRLVSVPESNVRLVKRHWDELMTVLPASVAVNPMDDVADRLGEMGIPFEELPGAESLDVLDWDSAAAIIGRDDLPTDSRGEPAAAPASDAVQMPDEPVAPLPGSQPEPTFDEPVARPDSGDSSG